MSVSRAPLFLVANARMPSQRAQSLQVAQCAAAYERAGAPTTLLYAKRRDTPVPAEAGELWERYGVPAGAQPKAEAISCVDLIDSVPTKLQYLPARVQELSFARAAAKRIRRADPAARVLCREIDAAHGLRGRKGLFLEIHRVPGGRKRRQWLSEVAQHAAGFLAISGGVAEDLIGAGIDADAVRVEHDGFQPERFAGQPSREAARAELGLESGACVAVYTGGLLRWKGVDVLVDAAREVPEVQFVIAGGMDADVARLREYAAGLANVRIDGFQAPNRVPLYLAAADMGVVPNRATPAISARYTSPLKVFEAMAVELPLVVSDLPSLRDILSEREALFVAPEDAGKLAKALRNLASNPAKRHSIGTRLGARAADYTWDARAERILQWMEERS
jgi:glycosyltransferase involved in cell wall biosynthesis